MSNTPINWIEKEVKIGDIKPFEKNPRRISKESIERLQNSIEQDGFHQRPLVNLDMTMIGGHARIKALKKIGCKNSDKIKVLMPEKLLSKEEFERINIRDNGMFGEYVVDDLANMGYKIEDYIEWGVPDYIFGDIFIEDNEELTEDVKEKDLLCKCPKCGHEWEK